MRGLTGLAWRSLTARRLRTVFTVAGIAFGVALLFASLVTDATIDVAAERTVRDRLGSADLRVTAFGELGLGPASLEAIRGTTGVEVAAPELERRTFLGGATATAGSTPRSVSILGIDPGPDAQLHDLQIVAGRRLEPSDGPAAVITAHLAADDGLGLGASITVLGAGAPATYRVVGIVAGDGPLGSVAGRTVIVPITTAQAVFADTHVTRVDVGLAAGADPATVTHDFESRLLAEPYVVTTPADLGATLRASTSEFATTTALIAAIALFAGAFLIFNTLSMTVIERSREIGLLRAAGATARQIARFVLIQALVVGVIGASFGLLLGALFANAMVAYVRTIGDVVLDPPRLPVSSMLASLAVGVLVTLAAAAEPARRAARIPPVEALKARLDLPTARRARLRWLAFVFTIVALAGVALWPRGDDSAAVIRPILIYVVLLGLTLSIPVLIPLLARIGGLPFRWPLVLEERLARATLVRDRGRATLTIGALAIGLALVVALGGVGETARAAAGAWVAEVVPGDVLVTSIRPIAADEGVAADLDAVDGVTRVSPIAIFPLAADGQAIDGAAMVGQDLVGDGRLTLLAGDRLTAFAALDAGGGAIIPAGLATRLGVALGDSLTVAAVDGSTIELKIVAVAARTLPGASGEALIVGWTDATAKLGVTGADAFAVRFVPAAPEASRSALRAVATESALEVVSLEQVRGAIDAALVRIFGLFDALSIIAVIVAALGIANTLTMDVIERVREIGVLRAAGMTRRQVWRSVVVEAGIVGFAGAILGSLGGVAVGALMGFLAAGGSSSAPSIPWPSVGVALVLGVVLAMLAAAYPAGLAARIPIVRAVSYE